MDFYILGYVEYDQHSIIPPTPIEPEPDPDPEQHDYFIKSALCTYRSINTLIDEEPVYDYTWAKYINGNWTYSNSWIGDKPPIVNIDRLGNITGSVHIIMPGAEPYPDKTLLCEINGNKTASNSVNDQVHIDNDPDNPNIIDRYLSMSVAVTYDDDPNPPNDVQEPEDANDYIKPTD